MADIKQPGGILKPPGHYGINLDKFSTLLQLLCQIYGAAAWRVNVNGVAEIIPELDV